MHDAADTDRVIVTPPLAWGLAVIAGLALDWLVPLPFLPAGLPAAWLGALVFVLALALFAWAIVLLLQNCLSEDCASGLAVHFVGRC
jgi:hypothetical protein